MPAVNWRPYSADHAEHTIQEQIRKREEAKERLMTLREILRQRATVAAVREQRRAQEEYDRAQAAIDASSPYVSPVTMDVLEAEAADQRAAMQGDHPPSEDSEEASTLKTPWWQHLWKARQTREGGGIGGGESSGLQTAITLFVVLMILVIFLVPVTLANGSRWTRMQLLQKALMGQMTVPVAGG